MERVGREGRDSGDEDEQRGHSGLDAWVGHRNSCEISV
jgi:hypothetical protein